MKRHVTLQSHDMSLDQEDDVRVHVYNMVALR